MLNSGLVELTIKHIKPPGTNLLQDLVEYVFLTNMINHKNKTTATRIPE